MKAKNYVKQFTQPSQEMQTIRSGETGSVARKPEGKERQTSERTPYSMRWKEPIFGVIVTNSLLKLRLNVTCL